MASQPPFTDIPDNRACNERLDMMRQACINVLYAHGIINSHDAPVTEGWDDTLLLNAVKQHVIAEAGPEAWQGVPSE